MKSKEVIRLTSADAVLKLTSQNFKGFKNTACEFWPCHPEEEMDGMGCMSCYCPLYYLKCPGKYTRLADGRKDCSQCTIIHAKGGWEIVQQYMGDPRPDDFIKVQDTGASASSAAADKSAGDQASVPVLQEF